MIFKMTILLCILYSFIKHNIYTFDIELEELKQNKDSLFGFFNEVKHYINLQISYLTYFIVTIKIPIIV